MIPLFLAIFVLCLLYNHVMEGGQFVTFSRFVEYSNSFRERTPRSVKIMDKTMVHEMKCGNRLYAMIIPKKPLLRWTKAACLINDDWKEITKEVEYYAGPFRNFYEIPITPVHINPRFQKMGFQMESGGIVHVEANEIIFKKLKLAKAQSKN